MITEDYVSYEVSKLLKEKGFDTFKPYGWDEELFDTEYPRNFSINFDSKEHWISCPTHQTAMKWLRQEKNIIINIWYDGGDWNTEYYNNEDENFHLITCLCNSYEEAVEAALKYCLENLI